MTQDDSHQQTNALKFRLPFWSSWKSRLVASVVVLGVTIWSFRSDDVYGAHWIWLALAWCSVLFWLRRDIRAVREGSEQFVLDEEGIRTWRFGREANVPWSEVTGVGFGDAHLRLTSATQDLAIPFNLPGYDRLHRFVCAHLPTSTLQASNELPIRFRYELGFSLTVGSLALAYVAFVGYDVLASAGYGVFAWFFAALFVVPVAWIVGTGVYRDMTTFEFQRDRVIVRSPLKEREYLTSGLLDMHLETIESNDREPETRLNLIFSGGEYVTVRDGSIGVGELFNILKPHYQPGRPMQAAKSDSILGV